jgi:hypothetical protein
MFPVLSSGLGMHCIVSLSILDLTGSVHTLLIPEWQLLISNERTFAALLSYRVDCGDQMSDKRKTAANLLRSAPLISDPPYIATPTLIGECILYDTIRMTTREEQKNVENSSDILFSNA